MAGIELCDPETVEMAPSSICAQHFTKVHQVGSEKRRAEQQTFELAHWQVFGDPMDELDNVASGESRMRNAKIDDGMRERRIYEDILLWHCHQKPRLDVNVRKVGQ